MVAAELRPAVRAAAKAASEELHWQWRLTDNYARAWRPGDPDLGKWLSRGEATIEFSSYRRTYEIRFNTTVSPMIALASLHGVVLHAESRKAIAK